MTQVSTWQIVSMIQPNPIQDTVCTKIEEILEIKKKGDKEFCKNRKRDEMIISGLQDITAVIIMKLPIILLSSKISKIKEYACRRIYYLLLSNYILLRKRFKIYFWNLLTSLRILKVLFVPIKSFPNINLLNVFTMVPPSYRIQDGGTSSFDLRLKLRD